MGGDVVSVHSHTSVVVTDGDLDFLKAVCHTNSDGHIACLRFGPGVTVQTDGDGTRRMLELLDTARDRVVAAHKAWLADMAGKAREAEDSGGAEAGAES